MTSSGSFHGKISSNHGVDFFCRRNHGGVGSTSVAVAIAFAMIQKIQSAISVYMKLYQISNKTSAYKNIKNYYDPI